MKCNQKVNRKSIIEKTDNYGATALILYLLCALCSECIPLCIAIFIVAGGFACKAIHLWKELGN